jgi:hypothetical protein
MAVTLALRLLLLSATVPAIVCVPLISDPSTVPTAVAVGAIAVLWAATLAIVLVIDRTRRRAQAEADVAEG